MKIKIDTVKMKKQDYKNTNKKIFFFYFYYYYSQCFNSKTMMRLLKYCNNEKTIDLKIYRFVKNIF